MSPLSVGSTRLLALLGRLSAHPHSTAPREPGR